MLDKVLDRHHEYFRLHIFQMLLLLQEVGVSPFRVRSRSTSPHQLMSRQASPVRPGPGPSVQQGSPVRQGLPVRHSSPHRSTSVRPHQQLHQQLQQQQLPQKPAVPAGNLMVNSWQQKVQEDLERYKRVGQENMSATGRQDMSATRRQNLAATQGKEVTFPSGQKPASFRQQSTAGDAEADSRQMAQVNDRGIGVLGRRLQAAQSMDRRRRLVHQQTADVVPRLDSIGYGAPAGQPTAALGGLGVSRRNGSIRASAPPWTGGPSTRRLSPSRFAEREQEPLLASGFNKSQRIGAMH